ncbi:hypothetical protein BaRGS_00026821, partial [Batillaria attramentaria]
ILPVKSWTLPDNTVNSSAIENAVDTDTLSCVALTGTGPVIDIFFQRPYNNDAYEADGLQLKVSADSDFSMSHNFTAGTNMAYVWDGTGDREWVRIGLRQRRYSSSTSITLTLCGVKAYDLTLYQYCTCHDPCSRNTDSVCDSTQVCTSLPASCPRGKNKKRKRHDASSDSSGTGNATFLISGESADLNMSAAMSDANVQKILNKIAQCKSETVRELITLLSKAEGEMKDELERVTGTLLELQIENTRLRQTVEKYTEQQDDMMSEINSLKGIVKTQDKRLHGYEQYGRRNSVRIYGLPEDARDESAHQTGVNVRKFCRDKLGVSLAETDIDIAHRLEGRQQDRHRSVIVKFVRRDVKQQVLKQRRKLKQTGIMVTDDLTPRHQQLLRDMKE